MITSHHRKINYWKIIESSDINDDILQRTNSDIERCWRYVKEELREVSCLMEMCYLVNDGFDLHFDERKLFRVSYVLKTKNRLVNDAPLDKHRKLGTGRIMASTTSSRGKQALIPVTTNQKKVGLKLLLCPLGSNIVLKKSCCSVGVILPVYSTFKATETNNRTDQQKMLLYWTVSDEGENWSMGQRQLFCLGRVLLRRNRILVLDEETASIDSDTDATVKKIIRQEYSSYTILTVAHRIPTVIDSDMAMVLSFEPELLSSNDVLWTFVKSAGEDNTNFETLVAFLKMLSTLVLPKWPILPEIQEGDAKALVAYLCVLCKVVENGNPIKRKTWFSDIEPLFKLLSYENVLPYLKGLLDVADNLDRASLVVKESFAKLDTSSDSSGAVPLLKTLLEGVKMTEKQLADSRMSITSDKVTTLEMVLLGLNAASK
ncbi:ABC transporter C family member 8-like protein [Tanacetum coccineum]